MIVKLNNLKIINWIKKLKKIYHKKLKKAKKDKMNLIYSKFKK